MRKSLTLVIILFLTASNALTIKSAYAQTKPSVPEFTTKYIDLSYDEPPTYGLTNSREKPLLHETDTS